jgi:hypothetical protein
MAPNGNGAPPDTGDFVTPAAVEEELNAIESLRASLSGQDDFLEAMLRNQRLLGMQMLQNLQMGGLEALPIEAVETTDTGVPTDYPVDVRVVPPAEILNDTNLPLAAVGKAAEDIRGNDTGTAVFQRQGTIFSTTVRATENIAGGDNIRVIAPGNIVETLEGENISLPGFGDESGTFAYRGNTYTVPVVSDTGQHIRVANQRYNKGNREDVEATLAPGEEKVFAQIEVPTNKFVLAKHTNASAHDSAEYNYYVDTRTERDEDLSGTVPWATPPDLYELNEEGYMFVEDYIELRIAETSGSATLDNVQGTLTAIVVEV